MNLLITGGAGFIGSALVHRLLSPPRGKDDSSLPLKSLVVMDALTYAGTSANLDPVRSHPLFHFVHGDIADPEIVARVFREHAITDVIHLAAESHVDRSIDDPGPFLRTNVEGTFRLLETARRSWPSLTGHRFLHVSTDEVFGALAPEDPPFSESSPYAPRSPYAASKAAGDHLVRAYYHTYGLPILLTHGSNTYGPRQFPEKLVPLMLLNALERKPLPIYGDGRHVRDWLHVDDHVGGILAAFQRGRPGESYVFGAAQETSNLELVRLLCRTLDRRQPSPQGPYEDLITVPDRPGHDRRYALDSAKARRELQWTPREKLTTGLERTVDWYLANRPWCEAISQKNYHRQRLGLLPTDPQAAA
jgi:dTDP-glucose 4,6-dehydratase